MRRPTLIALALLLAVASGALAAAGPGPTDRDRLDRIVRFLQDTQNDDGGYGGSPGAPSDPMISAWVGIGLAAAGINPQDQRAPGAGPSVAQYLAGQGASAAGGRAPATTEYERIGMFVNAAGLDPYRFGGQDYVTPMLQRQSTTAWQPPTTDQGGSDAAPDLPPGAGGLPTTGAASGTNPVAAQPVPAGWFPHVAGGRTPGVNDTIFAIFFLVGVGGDATKRSVARAARAVEAMQRPDGTWPATKPGAGTNVDMTGAAVQALCAARRCGSAAVRRALAWLREHQQPDGGWQAGDVPGERPGESNSGTTPWVVQALWAAGIDPATWRRGGRDPLAFLTSLQRRDGSIRWRQSRDLNATWMTAYAAPAFAGQAWPVPAPPRASAVRAAKHRAAAQERRKVRRRAVRAAERTGRAGEVVHGGGAVSGGGGGRGASLFSRPQPQSRGATPGGRRDTRHDQARRPGTQGRNGATGTAAASGPGDAGGVQNGRRVSVRTPDGTLVSGQVVQEPRGTQGDRTLPAIAPGLRAADAGDATPSWLPIAFAALALVAFAGGLRTERRRPTVTSP